MRAMNIIKNIFKKSNLKVNQKRKQSIIFAVESLLKGSRLGLTALGRSSPSKVAVKHNIKRMDRLLGNHKLHAEILLYFRAMTRMMTSEGSRPIILVDWTDIKGSKFRALTAAVPVAGRALPIYWEVHPEKGKGSRKVQYAFVDTLATLLPKGCRPIIVTDAGFCNPWFSKLTEHGWDWVGRLGIAKVRVLNESTWQSQEQLRQLASKQIKEIGMCMVARKKCGKKHESLQQRVIVGKKFVRSPNRGKIPRRRSDRGRGAQQSKDRNREAWVLGTSMTKEDASIIDSIYRKRMKIEEAYRDAKNHRFGWSFEDARASTAERYQVLLLIATFAMLLVTLVGMAGEKQCWHYKYQANTVRKVRVLSLFYFGKQLLQRKEVTTIKVGLLRDMLVNIQTQLVLQDA